MYESEINRNIEKIGKKLDILNMLMCEFVEAYLVVHGEYGKDEMIRMGEIERLIDESREE